MIEYCSVCGEQFIGKPSGCATHGFVKPKQKENKTMNYIEAVKELVNNPKAVAITFKRHDGETARIQIRVRKWREEVYHEIVFQETPTKPTRLVMASSVEFLLREDFTMVYKEEKKYTEIELGNAYHKGFEVGLEKAKRELKAYNEFKAAMKTIFGE